jgi:hypothetical protein
VYRVYVYITLGTKWQRYEVFFVIILWHNSDIRYNYFGVPKSLTEFLLAHDGKTFQLAQSSENNLSTLRTQTWQTLDVLPLSVFMPTTPTPPRPSRHHQTVSPSHPALAPSSSRPPCPCPIPFTTCPCLQRTAPPTPLLPLRDACVA